MGMSMPSQLFARYEQFCRAADAAFEQVAAQHPEAVRCERGCTDCCHALFGLFPVEAAYLRAHFARLESGRREEVYRRAAQAAAQLARFEAMLKEAHGADPTMQAQALSRERIRCPLLNKEGDCVLYAHRPVTCRVYGIPTRVNGAGRTCWKAAFEPGGAYPAFNLDRVYYELYQMSKTLLKEEGQPDTRAGLLKPVSAILKRSSGD